ncbi:hypothetical protein HO133_003883 [Letharia lupina]|uniref:ER membrane protein complex subunit 7 beta-sandwich domain-containing protein n=1 Tax=Letharia lupina TaxID=560253 RepID=A0A8H6CB24_9LECA|nr:uncharacterized protein HO133_003883 [Letharia lupina]KAF6220058.1 hypothetical protein HO133_003883 [Letharia lupina]
MLLPHLLVSLLPTLISAATLTLSVPPHIPALPPSTSAILTTHGQRIKVPVTRSNTFVFRNLTSPSTSDPASSGSERGISVSYLLDIACRDYDFLSYGVDVKSGGVVQVYRVSRGGIVTGEKVTVGEEPVEVRVLRGRDYYEARAGFSPLDLLKNPMILIAVVGLGFVVGMPYLMDSMDPEMKKEFEEQQKKSILSGGASTANPLQNFDMAGWMAAKTSGKGTETGNEGSGRDVRRRG